MINKICAIETYLKQNQIKKTPPFMGKEKQVKPMWLIQQEINNYARLHK